MRQEMKAVLIRKGMKGSRSALAFRKRAMVVSQRVPKIAARKYQTEKERSERLEPKKTTIADKKVRMPTITIRIEINCISLL